MGRLSNLLERAFENKGNKNRYTDGDWSIGFNERAWDTRFELYYKNVPVLEGNTLDKELKVLNGYTLPLEQFVSEVEKALPDYHFDIRVCLLIPVDFNEHWETEVEGAEYDDTVDECRYENIEDGYGYDTVLFSVGSLSDLKKVRIIEADGEVYKIDEYEMRLNEKGNAEATPTCLCPVMVLADEIGSDVAINTDKLEEYLEEEMILEFESDTQCMEYFNTYDGQNFASVEELKEYQGEYGFGIDGKWYHISFDEALDVRIPVKKKALDNVIDDAKSKVVADNDTISKDIGER